MIKTPTHFCTDFARPCYLPIQLRMILLVGLHKLTKPAHRQLSSSRGGPNLKSDCRQSHSL